MASWLDNIRGKETEVKDDVKEQQDLELKPEEVRAELKKIDGLGTEVKAIRESMGKLDDVSTWIAEQRRMQAEAQAKENQKKQKEQTEELDWITDPETATRSLIQPLVTDSINNSSMIMRQQILGDDAQYEYYTGEFKTKVDAYINGLPLNRKADPSSIINCYKLVLGEHVNEIKENKLKSRFSQVSSAGDGTGGTGAKSDKTVVLTDQEKRVARAFGIKEDDYAKNREVAYI